MYKVQNTYKNRDVGYLFSFISFFLFIYMFKEKSLLLAGIFFILSCILLFISLVIPVFLSPIAKIWYVFGSLLGRITSPIILGVIFFGLIAPIAVFSRCLGRDELRLKKRVANTYWINRESGSSISSSFKNQF